MGLPVPGVSVNLPGYEQVGPPALSRYAHPQIGPTYIDFSGEQTLLTFGGTATLSGTLMSAVTPLAFGGSGTAVSAGQVSAVTTFQLESSGSLSTSSLLSSPASLQLGGSAVLSTVSQLAALDTFTIGGSQNLSLSSQLGMADALVFGGTAGLTTLGITAPSALTFGGTATLSSIGSLANGLLAFWRLGESSGSSRLDSSGNNQTFAEQGLAVSSVPGKVGNAAAFNNSTTGRLAAADSAYTRFGDYFTLSFWWNPSASQSHFFATKNGQFGMHSVYDFGSGSYILQVVIYNQSNPSNPVIGSVTVTPHVYTPGVWYFFCVRRNGPGANVQMRINSANYSGLGNYNGGMIGAADSTPFVIGGVDGSTLTTSYFDSVGKWSRALSDSEVNELYNSGSGFEI